MRLMGIDYGEKRIGIALSDESVQFAFPHSVIENSPNTIKKIRIICQENKVGEIILGQSLDYKKLPNPIMGKTDRFKAVLEKELDLPVVYQWEVLTTKEAERIPAFGEARPPLSNLRKMKRRRQGRHKKIDASAAALILKSFIEKEKMVE